MTLGPVGYTTQHSLSATSSEALGAIPAAARTSATSHEGVGMALEPPANILHSVASHAPRNRSQHRACANDKPQNWYLFNDADSS